MSGAATADAAGAHAGGFAGRYGPVAAVLGAGQGIGRAFALECARRGLDVAAVDVDARALAAVCDAVRAEGRAAHPLELDLGSRHAADALARLAADHAIGLGVCSAARSFVGPFLETPLDAHREALAVNCGGVLCAAHALAGPMRARGRGGLVVLSSLAGLQGTGHVAGYSATKAFDLALAEALWWELAPHGVHVLGLVAGSTDTPGFRASAPRLAPGARLDAAEDVAREGLDHLADGPRWIAGEANRRIAAVLEAQARGDRVRTISDGTRQLYGK